jgi:hypothetical protein
MHGESRILRFICLVFKIIGQRNEILGLIIDDTLSWKQHIEHVFIYLFSVRNCYNQQLDKSLAKYPLHTMH